MRETIVEEKEKHPKSVEEAIGFIGTGTSFKNKAEKLVKDILKDHIDVGSSEYKPIVEDAIGEVMEKMFEMIAKGQTDSEWYTTGLSKYGAANCVITPYMYRSVGNYARTRYDRWSDMKPGTQGGARAREVVPLDVDETDSSVEDWISTKVSELPNSDIEKAASQKKLNQILEATSLPNDIISIIMHKCDNFTFEEIGDKMGLSKDAIRMKLNRAKPILSSVLERDV